MKRKTLGEVAYIAYWTRKTFDGRKMLTKHYWPHTEVDWGRAARAVIREYNRRRRKSKRGSKPSNRP